MVVASRRLELGEGKVFEEGGLRSWEWAKAGRRVQRLIFDDSVYSIQ
jgi:hypothetical protein